MLLVGRSESVETNALLNLIGHQPGIYEIVLWKKIHIKQTINC